MHIFSDFQAVWLLLAHALSWFGVVHALLTKRDPRSALGWTTAMLFLPVLGLLGYLLLGISRAESRAAKLLHKAAQAQPRRLYYVFFHDQYCSSPVAGPPSQLPWSPRILYSVTMNISRHSTEPMGPYWSHQVMSM